MNTVLLLVPDFCLILLGFALHRSGHFADTFWRTLERLIYFFLFPALLFLSTATARLEFASVTGLVVTTVGATLTGMVLGLATRWLTRSDPVLFASSYQTAFRFNSYIALAIAGRLGGEAGIALMAVIVAFNVPFANIGAVLMLARQRQTNIVRELLQNPLIVATLGGLAFNLAGFELLEVPRLILSRLGNASIALGLIAVGAGLRLQRDAVTERGMAVALLAIKQLALPAVALLLGRQFELPLLQQQMAVMFAAMPTASSCYILAVRMGGNGPIVAFLITIGTLLSLITLPLWLALVPPA